MKKIEAYRQGDVILVRLTNKAKGEHCGHHKLALGEVTGHSHQIVKKDHKKAKLIKFDDRLHGAIAKELASSIDHFETKPDFILSASDLVCLMHEEHKALTLPEGDYAVIIQRDYQPKGWTKVMD